MKYVRLLVNVLLCCCILCSMAFAEESVGDSGGSEVVTETNTDAGDTGSVDTDSGAESTEGESDVVIEDESGGTSVIYVEPDPVVMGYSTFELDESEGRTESTISDAVVAIFGEYQPLTTTVTDHLSDGSSVTYEQVVDGIAGVDWVWVASVGLFGLVLYSLLRLLGVFFK